MTGRQNAAEGETEPVLLRSLSPWLVIFTFYGIIGLFCLGAALNSDVPLLGRAACGAITVGIAAILARTRRAGLLLEPIGLTVRRYCGRDVEVRWCEVTRAEVVPNGKGGGFVAVVLNDGRVLKTQGLSVNSLDSKFGQDAVAVINAYRMPDSSPR